MNGTLRFLLITFFLALYYHWLCDGEDWAEDSANDSEEDSHEYLISRLSQSLRESGDQVVKTDNTKLDEPNMDDLHTRQFLIDEIRHSCLPRLVCELFAMEDKSTLSESERSLMSLISQTSLGTRGSSSSHYHFAAHMGQLLVGIDGNGCQNFYPACPLAGNQALDLARKMKIR